MRKLALLSSLICVGLLVGTLTAKRGELDLKTGLTVTGEITETSDGYQVIAAGTGATSKYRKDEVKGLPLYFDTAEEGYKLRKARVGAKDVDGWYELACWADKNGLNDAMGEAAKAVLALSPDHAMAKLLVQKYERGLAKPSPTPGASPSPSPRVATSQGDVPMLTDADVNIIRLVEMPVGFRDAAPKFAPKFLENFWDTNLGTKEEYTGKGKREKFLNATLKRQLEIVMSETDADDYWKLAEKVKIATDPPALKLWRTRVSSWMVNTCGSSACHGGKTPPWRIVSGPGGDSPRPAYTNFFVASEYVSPDGSRLLDRDKVEDSLMIRYALVPEQSDKLHPKVNGRAIPTVMHKGDVNYRAIEQLIKGDNMLRSGLHRVQYHITLPGLSVPPPK